MLVQPPPFVPHPWVRGGHAQTLAGVYLPSGRTPERGVRHVVALEDGDQIVLHDDCPNTWRAGEPCALLLHGLSGSYASDYMRRMVVKLSARSMRVWRMDLRGAGAGAQLAKRPYHAGRSADVAAAVEYVARVCPGSLTWLVGFSLGGNLALKLLGELGDSACGNVAGGVSVSPPIELATCSRAIGRGLNRAYDRHFVRQLTALYWQRVRDVPEAPQVELVRSPRSLWEFDDRVTAPLGGFAGAEAYYESSSSAPLLAKIRKPTLVLSAANDPLIPAAMFARAKPSAAVQLHVTDCGGHLGFIARRGSDPDIRWMDWRIIDWLTRQSA